PFILFRMHQHVPRMGVIVQQRGRGAVQERKRLTKDASQVLFDTRKIWPMRAEALEVVQKHVDLAVAPGWGLLFPVKVLRKGLNVVADNEPKYPLRIRNSMRSS